ncbi:HAD-IA family hydrolase [Pseudoroseicyclus tamaricis]|uniref:HAD-IA family hydrolase n=1 Tax=Pseudoroseicyclus tamaricis TaxID=2705421 RepID=A0A6B2JVG9_9RHOB|nr:HAD-IA family hydrolase [Pseudoroseicyclus tamaricis]NDV02080.1 HAD-IA family hydrolase [Pseudoroseicyclus tamaricis]
MSEGIAAVVFDVGNVLIEWQPERFYDAEIGEEARRAMFEEVDLHAMNERVDRGEAFRDVIEEVAAANPDHATAIMLWHDRWADIASPVIDRSVRLFRALKRKGVPCHILSNIGEETFAIAADNYPFFEEFDRVFLSGPLRMAKPDGAIYAHVEGELGLAGERLFFTDDRADNIEMAASRGWHTHLFNSPSGLAAKLVEEGLLTAEEAA